MACLSGLSRERTGRLRLHQHRAVIPAYTRHGPQSSSARLIAPSSLVWQGFLWLGLDPFGVGSNRCANALCSFRHVEHCPRRNAVDGYLGALAHRSVPQRASRQSASWLLLVASSLGAVAHFDAQLQAQAQACIPANCACRCLSTYVPSVTRAS